MSKDAYWFKHDSNASQDPKILQMCSVYKAEGYGWYWMLIEQMRDQANYKLNISGKYAIDAFASRFYANALTLHSFIDDCCDEFHLFKKDKTYLWSESLLRRMTGFNEKSEKARKSAEARWGKQNQSNANAMRTHNESNANASKSDAIREDKIREDKKISPSEISKSLTQVLRSLILENNPIARVPDNLDKWELEIDRMIRIDKRPSELIEKVIRFSQGDTFWKANILSAGTLRDKFDQLLMKMNGGAQNGTNQSGNQKSNSRQLPTKYTRPEDIRTGNQAGVIHPTPNP